MRIITDRLDLHLIEPSEALRIIARTPVGTDSWHPEYPLDDELGPLATLGQRDSSVDTFGLYMIRNRDDGLAVGGIGFFGPPDEHGAVEIGYGLVPAARGQGRATEALRALIEVARQAGVKTIRADTVASNRASQNVLIKVGFGEVRRTGESIWYSKTL